MFETTRNEPRSFAVQIGLSIAIAIPVGIVFFVGFFEWVVSRPPNGAWLVPAGAIYIGAPISGLVALFTFLIALSTQVIADQRRLAREEREGE